MSFQTIEEINANPIYAPIGDEINFIRRINRDKIKNFKKKEYYDDGISLGVKEENNIKSHLTFHYNPIIQEYTNIKKIKEYLKQNGFKNHTKFKKKQLLKLTLSF